MIGNAVPVMLAYHMALQIRKTLREHGIKLKENEKIKRIPSLDIRQKTKIAKKLARKEEVVKQLNFLDLFDQYADNPIVENYMVHEELPEYGINIDTTKNCLSSLVKKDNFEQYLDQSARIYYTGKKFPSTVALNKLYYFMPYLKGNGIRDLYFIKIARVGTRKEGQEGENKNALRLVLEIEFVKQLFNEYKPVELKIWHTFTDTTMEEIFRM